MKCPKCASELGNSIHCSKCGINTEIFIKAKAISNKFYNKALVMANSQDLSSAIETLNKSIEFDKTNHTARNLLGLVYLEIGEIGNALKQWIISSSYFKDNNIAKNYIDTVQNNSRKLEKYNDAIKMYNKALNYMNQKSEDMAIIQLKKALEINPKFVEAYNLLALCYIHEKDNDKALSCVNKVLDMDITNKKALTYYNAINQGAQRTVKAEKSNVKANVKTYNPADKKLRKRSAFSDITSFIIGAVVVGVVMYVLMIPAIKKDTDVKISQLTESNEAMSKQLTDKMDENKQLADQYEKDKAQLSQENATLKAQLDEIEMTQKIGQIQSLYDNNQTEEAAQQLLALEGSQFNAQTQTLYDALKAQIIPEQSQKYYNQGMAQYSAKNYSEAKVLLEKSLSLSTNQSYSSDALYFSGRIAEINGDTATAKSIYQKVIDNYPQAKQFKNAKARLEALG